MSTSIKYLTAFSLSLPKMVTKPYQWEPHTTVHAYYELSLCRLFSSPQIAECLAGGFIQPLNLLYGRCLKAILYFLHILSSLI